MFVANYCQHFTLRSLSECVTDMHVRRKDNCWREEWVYKTAEFAMPFKLIQVENMNAFCLLDIYPVFLFLGWQSLFLKLRPLTINGLGKSLCSTSDNVCVSNTYIEAIVLRPMAITLPLPQLPFLKFHVAPDGPVQLKTQDHSSIARTPGNSFWCDNSPILSNILLWKCGICLAVHVSTTLCLFVCLFLYLRHGLIFT